MIAGFFGLRKPALQAGRPFLDRLLVPAIVVLVGLAAFGLGRLSVLTEQNGDSVANQPPTLEP